MREKSSCYVIMPRSEKMDRVFYDAIIPALQSATAEILPLRAESLREGNISLTARVAGAIEAADFCLVDVTGAHANVMIELGIAFGMSKPVIVIAEALPEFPGNLGDNHVLIYDPSNLDGFVPELAKVVDRVLGRERRRGKLRVTGFSPDLVDESQILDDFIQTARYTLSAVVGSPRLLVDFLLPLLADHRDRDVVLLRIVCADPEGEFSRMRALDSGTPIPKYREELWQSLKRLESMVRDTRGFRLELRLTQRMLGTAIYLSDEVALLFPYLIAGSGRETAGLVLFRESEPRGYSLFQQQFGKVWSEGVETSLFGRSSSSA